MTMQPSLRSEYADNVELNYAVVRSKKRKKTLSLQLMKDGSVLIRAPYHTPHAEIDGFFKKKQNWLYRRIEEREVIQASHTSTNFVAGQPFLFLGFPYSLIVDDRDISDEPFTFSGKQFILNKKYMLKAKSLFTEWYRGNAAAYIGKRVCHYSSILNLYPKRVRISNAMSRWGSCSFNNHLSFTWRLVMAPGAVIDYVVVHELAHIKEKNHSRHFWEIVEKVLPEWGTCRHWLRKEGHLLNV